MEQEKGGKGVTPYFPTKGIGRPSFPSSRQSRCAAGDLRCRLLSLRIYIVALIVVFSIKQGANAGKRQHKQQDVTGKSIRNCAAGNDSTKKPPHFEGGIKVSARQDETVLVGEGGEVGAFRSEPDPVDLPPD